MTFTVTETLPMSQRIRNRMSLAALVMTFMFGWVMFLAAHVIVGCPEVQAAATTSAK